MEFFNFLGQTPHVEAGALEYCSSFTLVISYLHWAGSLQIYFSHDALGGWNTRYNISLHPEQKHWCIIWDKFTLKKMEV